MVKEKYIQTIKETAINITQTQIDSVRKKNITKTGLRIYKDGLIGCSGAIGNYSETDLEEKAIKSLENKISYPFDPGKNIKMAEDFSSEIIPDDQVIDEFEELLSIIRKEQPDFYFSNKIKLEETEIKLQNDDGLDLSYRDRILNLELIFKEKTSVNIADGGVEFVSRKYNRNAVIKEINEVCNAFKNKVNLPHEGKLPVIFTTDNHLLYAKFWHDLNGNSFGSKSSLLSDKRGQKIFSENFTLYQTNNPSDGKHPFFDVEGVVNDNYRYSLIENGVLVTPFTNKRAAHKYNLPLTGSAQADYDSVPNLTYPPMKIKGSEKTVKELLNGQAGVMVVIASGGDFTPDGNFGTPVQLAFLFDGESYLGRLPELKISSNLFDMYGDSFIGVSKDTLNPLSWSRYCVIEMDVAKIY